MKITDLFNPTARFPFNTTFWRKPVGLLILILILFFGVYWYLSSPPSLKGELYVYQDADGDVCLMKNGRKAEKIIRVGPERKFWLTSCQDTPYEPVLSPDRKKVLFIRIKNDSGSTGSTDLEKIQKTQVVIYDLAKKMEKLLYEVPGSCLTLISHPAWAPDGQKVFFLAEDSILCVSLA